MQCVVYSHMSTARIEINIAVEKYSIPPLWARCYTYYILELFIAHKFRLHEFTRIFDDTEARCQH